MPAAMLVAGLCLLVVGAMTITVTARSGRLRSSGAADFLESISGGPVDPTSAMITDRLEMPFFERIIRPLGSGIIERLVSFTPSGYLDRVHQRLLLAGLTPAVRAEEFGAASVLSAATGVLLTVAWLVLASPATNIGLLGAVALPACFVFLPRAWLERKVTERKEAIFKDLPDVLDLMAMAVEAGTAFEGALALVADEFDSPLAEELARMLQEMELGISRRDALQNLKRRTEVPELSNFVLALTQADALGMPIGRILHVQAAEMRVRRRQWAREKAGKLPVKIVFPLVLFIFPAILVVILGPAFASIFTAFR